ncbi:MULTISPECIES: putative Ig domain-containing protein [Bradyrhizobium]|uniref:putative Ig domain-containing protein n=1 Tax=Bradyrhizobium TaxID=374 RepID=UPI001ED9DBB1|nr:putative Ig domain-containing protein [Bradyrhizobium zhengyangense]MCG2645267.1 putative Ig domain-containing protein [Bradyrhizobium zhengyangense]
MASVAYMTGSTNPWGISPDDPGSPETAMNLAFGVDNWTKFQGFTPAVFDGSYNFIFINTGVGTESEFAQFLNANLSAIEAFVSNGGRLFINDGSGADDVYLGFGATLWNGISSGGDAVDPSDPIFLGPVGDAGANWTGNWFSDGIIAGPDLLPLSDLTPLVTAGTDGLGNPVTAIGLKHYGAGVVILGSIADPHFAYSNVAPSEILLSNLLYYGAYGDSGPPPGETVVRWIGPASTDLDGDWNTSANWADSVPPSTAIVALPGSQTYTVTSAHDNQVSQLDIEGYGATLAITGGTFTITGTLRSEGNIDVKVGGLVVQGPALGVGASIETHGTLEFDQASSVNVRFANGAFSSLSASLVDPSSGNVGRPHGVNDAGEVVGSFGDQGFIYKNGSVTLFNYAFPGDQTVVEGVNGSGDIVGDYYDGQFVHAFVRYSDGSEFQFDADPLNPFYTSATGINNSGEIVGTYRNSSTGFAERGFLEIAGTLTSISVAGANTTHVSAVNDAGEIVGYYNDGAGQHGFVYENGAFTTFDDPLGAGRTQALGINDAGQIVGTYWDSNNVYHAYLFSNGAFTSIDDPSFLSPYGAVASGIGNNGSIVGYGYGSRPFVDFPGAGGMLKLGDPSEYTGTISGFAIGDTIELSTVRYDSGASVFLGAGNVLRIVEDGKAHNLNFDPAQDLSRVLFSVSAGSDGETEIKASPSPIAVDSTAAQYFSTASAASPFTVPISVAGSNRLLVVSIACGNGANLSEPDVVTSVIYAGEELSLVKKIGGAGEEQYLYVLVAPPTGAHNISVTTAPGFIGTINIDAADYTGVEQTIPVNYLYDTDAGQNSITIGPLHTALYSWVVGGIGDNAGNASVDVTGRTRADSSGSSGSAVYLFDSNGPTGGVDVSAQFHKISGFNHDVSSIMVELAPAQAGGASPAASNISGDANADTNPQPIILTALFTDADANDTFTFKIDTAGTKGTVINNGDGTFTYDPNGKFLYLPVGVTTTDTFLYEVTDSHGGSSEWKTATVTVHGEAQEVSLPDGLAAEMLRLALDAYPSQQTFHDSLALGRSPNQPALTTIQSDHWHALSADELGINSRGQEGAIQYSFVNGYYQAHSTDSAEQLLSDPSEADALVLTALVGGKRTLTISFAGTDQASDFLDYLDFATHWAKFAPLVEVVKQFIDANKVDQVLVSGHSLGSAMVDYFLSAIKPGLPESVKVEAYTDGYPGVEADVQIADGLANNFIHTDDLVYGLGKLSSLPQAEKDLILAAVPLAVEASAGPVAAEAAVLAAGVLASIEPKSQEGHDIFLNSDVSNTWSFEEHSPELYVADIQKLTAFAIDPQSVFHEVLAQPSISELGQALETNSLYQGPSIQVGVGQPNSPLIHIDGNDDVDLGGVYDSRGLLAPENMTFFWSPISNKVHYVDGGPGAVNNVVINESPAGYRWQTIDDADSQTHVELSYNGAVVGELYRITNLEFQYGSWAGAPPINLLSHPNGSGSELGSGLLDVGWKGSLFLGADGYIRGATVFADANGNGRVDAGEAIATTDATGGFDLAGGSGRLVLFGGTDTSSGLPFAGTLSAPSGSQVITPLTTIVSKLVDDGVPDAEGKVLAAFGLDVGLDLLSLDPVAAAKSGAQAGSVSFAAGTEIGDTLSMIASIIGGTDANHYSTAWNDTVAALAAQVVSLGQGQILDLTDDAIVKSLIDSVLQIEGRSLDPSEESASAQAIAASNSALMGKLTADGSGPNFVADVGAVENVAQGAASDALKTLAEHPEQFQNVLDTLTGSNLNDAISASLNYIATPPVVSSLAINPSNGDLGVGHSVQLILTFSKPVIVTGGVPTLSLDDGGVASFDAAATAALANSSKLVFTYFVSAGENSADVAVVGTDLNGAVVRDLTNNDADLAGAVANPSGIVIIDTTPPVLSSVSDQTNEAGSPAGAVALFTTIALDLVDGADSVVFKEGNTVVHSGDVFGLGAHTITASAVDAAGNIAAENFTIKVVDTTPPTLTPVSDRTVHATSLAGAKVTFSATASDLVDGADPVVFMDGSSVVHSGDTFALGTHTIAVNTVDAAGNTASESFTIRVADAAPVVSPITRSMGEDGPTFNQDLLSGARDPDAGDSLSVYGLDAAVTTAGGRSLVLGTDYTLSGSILSLTATGIAKFNSLGSSQSDLAVFHYGVTDGILTTADTLTLNVTGADDAPTLLHQTVSQSATAGSPFSLTLPSNTFQDPDNGDHLKLTATLSNGSALPSWLTFNSATGTLSATPAASDVGGFDIKITATDTGGLAATDVFHLTVTDHPPVITSDGGGSSASIIIADDTKYVDTVHATDPDPNTNMKYSIVGGQDQKLFAIDPTSGVLSFKSTPQDGHGYQVVVAASDGGIQDTQAINVQVAKGGFESGNANIADTFVFKPGFGLDIVNNFDATSSNHDVLELDHSLFHQADPHASTAATFDLILHHSFQVGPDVAIVTDTLNIIDLRNTTLHSLSAKDFILT